MTFDEDGRIVTASPHADVSGDSRSCYRRASLFNYKARDPVFRATRELRPKVSTEWRKVDVRTLAGVRGALNASRAKRLPLVLADHEKAKDAFAGPRFLMHRRTRNASC